MSNTLFFWIFTFFGWLAGLLFLLFAYFFIQDLRQTKSAIRRNFPLIGRLRYFLEGQGAYFRQYFLSHEREEMPFNRATRSWVYRKAKGLKGTIGFGSTYDLNEPGAIIFVNSAYPTLKEEQCPASPLVIGEQCLIPFYAHQIVNISGMSYGALSKNAVQALSIGAAKSGSWLNTGEGGLSDYHRTDDADIIFQIGTAKFGVRDEKGRLSPQKLKAVAKIEQVRAFEIKLSQGAKPGRGGMLPGIKVNAEIARVRGIPIGQDVMSPNRHYDIASPDELLDMIAKIRDITGKPVGFKTVIGSECYPEGVAEAILRRGIEFAPDFITVDGGEGGSGAAPQMLADHVGLSLSEALPMVDNIFYEAGLRDHIRLIASGKLITADQVAWALCVGADFTVTGRGFLFALGCIQSMQCHLDTCPTGITTQNPRLQKGLNVADKAARVANYARQINKDLDVIAHSCGLGCAHDFTREQVRIVQRPGHSMTLSQLYPRPKINPQRFLNIRPC